jgi:hypothetical protein
MLGEEVEDRLIDRAVAEGVANIVVESCGDGRVVLFGSHPEFGFSLAMDDETPPAQMLCNAVSWQLSQRSVFRTGVEGSDLLTHRESSAHRQTRGHVQALTSRLRDLTYAIQDRGVEAEWLNPQHAESVFGLPPVTIWQRSLVAIDRLSREIGESAAVTSARVINFRQPDELQLDCGYHGVAALLEQAVDLLDTTLNTWDFDPGMPSKELYAHFRTSPYHLVGGSYLAALGRVAGAALLCRAFPSGENRNRDNGGR